MINTNKVQVAVYQEAKYNNYYCGDSYFYTEYDNCFFCALADGLGSGEFAKESSEAVINVIKNNLGLPIEEMIIECNKQLCGKRGAVLGILVIDYHTGMYSYSSIGNIGIMIIDQENNKKRNMPNAGYLGSIKRSVKLMNGMLEDNMNFIMFSDGVTEKEIAQNFLFHKNVELIIDMFSEINKDERQDDTTLIAINYKEHK